MTGARIASAPLSALPRAMPLLAALAVLAGCAPTIVPRAGGGLPPPLPTPAPALATPGAVDWLDWPLTPGTWRYVRGTGSTIARFGAGGGAALAWVRCDLATRAITVGRSARPGESTGMMAVRTTFGTVEWPAHAVSSGAGPALEATRSASDPALDQIAFSRGRFALLLRDQPPVVTPAWAEPVRVVEDCRG